jgi:hypothetical protein
MVVAVVAAVSPTLPPHVIWTTKFRSKYQNVIQDMHRKPAWFTVHFFNYVRKSLRALFCAPENNVEPVSVSRERIPQNTQNHIRRHI